MGTISIFFFPFFFFFTPFLSLGYINFVNLFVLPLPSSDPTAQLQTSRRDHCATSGSRLCIPLISTVVLTKQARSLSSQITADLTNAREDVIIMIDAYRWVRVLVRVLKIRELRLQSPLPTS